MCTSGFTPINASQVISSENGPGPSVSRDVVASNATRNDPSVSRPCRNPQIAQYLGLDQHESSYSKFGISDDATADPFEGEVMCPQKPPSARRKKSEPKNSASKSKAAGHPLRVQGTRTKKAGVSASGGLTGSQKLPISDSNVVHNAKDSSAEVYLSTQTRNFLQSFRYQAPGELRRDNVETSDANKENLGPQTTMDALYASQGPHGLTLYTGSSLVQTVPSLPTATPIVHVGSSGAVQVLDPVAQEKVPKTLPTASENTQMSVAGDGHCCDELSPNSGREECHCGDLVDAFDELPDEDLLAFTSDLPLLDDLAAFSVAASSTPIHASQPFSARHHETSDTIPTSNEDLILASDQLAIAEDEWIEIEDPDPDGWELSQHNVRCPQASHLLRLDQPRPAENHNESPSRVSTNPVPTAVNVDEYADNILHPPIVRPPFPTPVRDRSPIMGVSGSQYLRTCFRVGEALREGCQATRCHTDVFLELYAKVDSSWRENSKQHFILSDLFHDRPPRIDGVFEGWNSNELSAYDTSRFLDSDGSKRMCRCIGKMKREKNSWEMAIQSIWEATWDDIEYVRGIFCVW